MPRKSYFRHLDFSKEWTEEDWGTFFRLQDEHLAQRRDPTIILRLAGRSGPPDEAEIDRALTELGLQHEIPVIKTLHKSMPDPENAPPVFDNPLHLSKEGARLEDLPVFAEACAFARAVADTLERLNRRRPGRTPRRQASRGERNSLLLHSCWAAVDIALGHKTGYDPETVRGNIVRCKRALRHADDCVGLVSRLGKRSRAQRVRRDLFGQAVRLRRHLTAWVEALRELAGPNPA